MWGGVGIIVLCLIRTQKVHWHRRHHKPWLSGPRKVLLIFFHGTVRWLLSFWRSVGSGSHGRVLRDVLPAMSWEMLHVLATWYSHIGQIVPHKLSRRKMVFCILYSCGMVYTYSCALLRNHQGGFEVNWFWGTVSSACPEPKIPVECHIWMPLFYVMW